MIKLAKVLMRLMQSIILNEYIISLFIFMYVRAVKPQITKGWTKYFSKILVNMHPTSRVLGEITVTNPKLLSIERYVRIGKGCFLFSDGGIEIQEGSILSRNITIYSGNHNVNGLEVPYDDSYIYKPVKIGRGVWIGMNVCITPGVTIGDGAIIGMGSVISKNVMAGEIVVGAEQRVVKKIDNNKFNFAIDKDLFFAKKWPDK